MLTKKTEETSKSSFSKSPDSKEIKNSDEHENREEDEESKEEIYMRVDIQSSRIQRDHYSQEQNRSEERDANSRYTTPFKSFKESEDE